MCLASHNQREESVSFFLSAYLWELRHWHCVHPFSLISASIYFGDLNLHLSLSITVIEMIRMVWGGQCHLSKCQKVAASHTLLGGWQVLLRS